MKSITAGINQPYIAVFEATTTCVLEVYAASRQEAEVRARMAFRETDGQVIQGAPSPVVCVTESAYRRMKELNR
jgi:hypothetical protein